MNQKLEEQRRLLEAGRSQLGRFKALAAVRLLDEERIGLLLKQGQPDLEGIIDAARLLKRYQPTEDPADPHTILHQMLQQVLVQWGMDEAQANAQARKAWADGYRPRVNELEVGSGAV
jgi:hypothetical protein